MTYKKNIFSLLLIVLIFTNIFSVFSQNKNTFFTGSIVQNSFVEEIPFDLVEGQIIIKVDIKNNIYNFLFDTGAPVVVDIQIANLLKKSKVYQNVFDSNGNIQKLPKQKINDLKIGKIVFKNITTIVSDLNYIKEIGCVNIQGVIGANLMANAVWQINYAQKKIIFTNNIKSLHLSSDFKPIKFTIEKTGTPIIPFYIEETKADNVIIDTGSRGSFTISKNDFQNIHKDLRTIISYGLSPGAFGVELDTMQTYKCKNILIGNNLKLDSTLVSIRNRKVTKKIGFEILKNYIVTLDWKNNEVYFQELIYTPLENNNSFGFNLIYYEGKVIIGKIYKNSSADLKGIKIFDEVLKINDINCENLSNGDYCLLKRDAFNSNKIKITIKRDKMLLDLILIKSDLFRISE
ncbi:aspartyl protease family protein [Flavobacterium sp. j3]|uniref:Aspartyl protease family protein n=1 Tax=Flavobacterium aureirubrum TaxID=3133147 RepID=A0ABU9N3W1_9FLAO